MAKYNSEAFTPEEVEKGSHLKLLNCLFDLNKNLDSGHYDIHITSDGYCLIIEWCQVFIEGDGEFKYVAEDQFIVTEKCFPDGQYYRFDSEEEYEESLKKWLDENPGWVKNEYGVWYNEEENEKMKANLGIE